MFKKIAIQHVKRKYILQLSNSIDPKVNLKFSEKISVTWNTTMTGRSGPECQQIDFASL